MLLGFLNRITSFVCKKYANTFKIGSVQLNNRSQILLEARHRQTKREAAKRMQIRANKGDPILDLHPGLLRLQTIIIPDT